jgi:hypothetical protein
VGSALQGEMVRMWRDQNLLRRCSRCPSRSETGAPVCWISALAERIVGPVTWTIAATGYSLKPIVYCDPIKLSVALRNATGRSSGSAIARCRSASNDATHDNRDRQEAAARCEQ